MILLAQVRKYIDVYFNIFSWAVLLTMHTITCGPVDYVR